MKVKNTEPYNNLKLSPREASKTHVGFMAPVENTRLHNEYTPQKLYRYNSYTEKTENSMQDLDIQEEFLK